MKRKLLDLRQAWREWRCDHWWRPANYRLHPAKVCEECGKVVELSHGQFYAEFGIVFSIVNSQPTLDRFGSVK